MASLTIGNAKQGRFKELRDRVSLRRPGPPPPDRNTPLSAQRAKLQGELAKGEWGEAGRSMSVANQVVNDFLIS